MNEPIHESINWNVAGRIAYHAVAALVVTTPLIAYLVAPIFWLGDLAVHPSFSDTMSALIAIMLTIVGIPPSFIEHSLPVGAAWLSAISSLSDAGVQASAPWISAGVAALLAAMSERRPLMLTVTEREERRAIHLRGPRVVTGDAAVGNGRAAEYQAICQSGSGIMIAPGLPISLRRETRQIMVVASIGGGKSEFLKFLVGQMIERGDRMIIHDPKGELLAEWPTDKFGILSPVDGRSLAWDVGSDCLGVASARELASKLVPASKSGESTWSDGAREVLFGLIYHLQRNVPQWHWGHLSDLLSLQPVDMRAILESSHRQATRYLELDADGIPTKTAQSFLVTLDSSVASIICQLAAAWGHDFAGERISLSKWLSEEDASPQALLLVSAADYSTLSRVWTGAAISLISRIVASPRMQDSATRRLWLVLDECKQLGRLEDFQALMEVGRSRGVRVITAWQDLRQIEQVYAETADYDVFTALPKTKIVLQCSAGASAKHISDTWIGERLVRLPDSTIRNGQVDSTASHETWIPVVTPQELDSDLGVVRGNDGTMVARGLILGIGPDVLMADWPPGGWRAVRPARVPAAWTGDCGSVSQAT